MTLLAIDPGRSFKGEKTIGYCLFSEEGLEIDRGSMTFDQLIGNCLYLGYHEGEFFLRWFRGQRWAGGIAEVVIENYVNNPQSKGGQLNGTSECVGAVEALCLLSGTPFTRQAPAKLGPAKLHAPEGSWKKLKHLRHEDSAFLHGYEYLVGKGVLQSAGLTATLGST